MKRIILAIGMVLVLLSGAADKKPQVNNSPVAYFDIDRFLGRWYEIARIDNRFEKDLQFVSAYYSIAPDNTIRVANKGTKDGYRKLTVAKAKTTDTEGLLKVAFHPPFYTEFRILYVSEDYEVMMIGSDRDDRLWIMARTPKISDEDASEALEDAMDRGYDISQLSWILQ